MTAVEGGNTKNVHIANVLVGTDVFEHLPERQVGKAGIGLLGLDGAGGAILNSDVIDDNGDAGVDGVVDKRAHGVGLAVVDDDAVNSGTDSRFHVGRLLGVVSLGVVPGVRDAQSVGLLLGAICPLLEVVASTAVLHYGNGDFTVERGRHGYARGCCLNSGCLGRGGRCFFSVLGTRRCEQGKSYEENP